MHRAANNGHLKIVEILLSKGAELDSRDNVSTYNNVMSLGHRTQAIKQLFLHTYIGRRIVLCIQPVQWLLIQIS